MLFGLCFVSVCFWYVSVFVCGWVCLCGFFFFVWVFVFFGVGFVGDGWGFLFFVFVFFGWVCGSSLVGCFWGVFLFGWFVFGLVFFGLWVLRFVPWVFFFFFFLWVCRFGSVGAPPQPEPRQYFCIVSCASTFAVHSRSSSYPR